MFTRLIDYFNGENVGKVKLDMTVPVMTFVFKRLNVTVMLFFIPLKHQASPPKSMNPEVSIPNVGKTCAYVKSFHWSSAKRVEMKVKELESALKKDGIKDYYGSDIAYGYAVYDSSWTIPFLRHKEVWLGQRSPT